MQTKNEEKFPLRIVAFIPMLILIALCKKIYIYIPKSDMKNLLNLMTNKLLTLIPVEHKLISTVMLR